MKFQMANRKKKSLGLCAALLLIAPAYAAPDSSSVASSTLPHSSVSLLVEPKLDDGRLVLKIAAQNRTAQAVEFGPGAVSITKPSGQTIALTSLQQLVQDVRTAAGMPNDAAGGAPTAGAYATRQQPTASDGSGRMDVTGYTAGSSIAPEEQLRWSNKSRESPAVASKIAALKQAILQDTTVQPGQVVAAMIVSQKLKFKRGEDRTLNVRVHIANDEHGFTIAAPSD